MNKEKLINAYRDNSPRTELSADEFQILMTLLLSKENEMKCDINKLDKESKLYQHFKPLIDSFYIQVFLKRLSAFSTIKVCLGALIMLAEHFENPAHVVMYAFYMHHNLSPNTLVDLDVFSTKLFPWGFFSEEQLNKIWDSQKVFGEERPNFGSDNLLDYPEIWK